VETPGRNAEFEWENGEQNVRVPPG
jgi:hypothetical protein